MSESIIAKSLFAFLRKLKKNNDRNWFAEQAKPLMRFLCDAIEVPY